MLVRGRNHICRMWYSCRTASKTRRQSTGTAIRPLARLHRDVAEPPQAHDPRGRERDCRLSAPVHLPQRPLPLRHRRYLRVCPVPRSQRLGAGHAVAKQAPRHCADCSHHAYLHRCSGHSHRASRPHHPARGATVDPSNRRSPEHLYGGQGSGRGTYREVLRGHSGRSARQGRRDPGRPRRPSAVRHPVNSDEDLESGRQHLQLHHRPGYRSRTALLSAQRRRATRDFVLEHFPEECEEATRDRSSAS